MLPIRRLNRAITELFQAHRLMRAALPGALLAVAALAAPVRAELAIPDDMAQRMERAGVAGVSVVLVDAGRIVAAEAFGVASARTGERLAIDDVFEAASNGKIVAAYALLRLDHSGQLSLGDTLHDARIDSACGAPAVAAVLSHSAGLGNDIGAGRFTVNCDRRGRFSYAGEGYVLLEPVFRAAVGEPSTAHIERLLFEPLGMSRSAMGRTELPIVDGHIDLLFAALSGRAAAGGQVTAWSLVIAAVALWIFLIWWLRGKLGIVTLILVSLLELAVACVAVLVALAVIPATLSSENRGNDIASSFKTTAPDLARFAIELMNPKLAPASVIEEMTTPTVRVNRHTHWGLGIGIDTSDRAPSWWHWGSNPGYQSLMVMQPDLQRAVVVLTNSGGFADFVLPARGGYALARELTRDILGIEGHWSIGPTR